MSRFVVMTLHTRPEVVIETGVAHGVSTRIVLEALTQNDLGHLWSIDLLHPFNHRLHADKLWPFQMRAVRAGLI